jgi:trehalose 6-phosphate phosphatase
LSAGHSFVAAVVENPGMTHAVSSSDTCIALPDQLLSEARAIALFLDLDGTLLDIAATPDAVRVPDDLVANLAAAAMVLGGALAIVSGRDIGDIDRLLAPLKLPAAGGHGCVVRFPDGTRDEVATKVPPLWIEDLQQIQHAHKGVLIEPKTHSVVAHYRNAPQTEALLRETAGRLVAQDNETFEVLSGHMMVEMRPRLASKGGAVHKFMPVEPFAGRKPVFIGDDLTDEDGFAAAVELGGVGLHVAEHFGGEPQHVRRWLKQLAQG